MAKTKSKSTMASSPSATVGGKRYVLIGKSRVTTVPTKSSTTVPHSANSVSK